MVRSLNEAEMATKVRALDRHIVEAEFGGEITSEATPALEVGPRYGNEDGYVVLDGLRYQGSAPAAFAFGLAELVDDYDIRLRRKRVARAHNGIQQRVHIETTTPRPFPSVLRDRHGLASRQILQDHVAT